MKPFIKTILAVSIVGSSTAYASPITDSFQAEAVIPAVLEFDIDKDSESFTIPTGINDTIEDLEVSSAYCLAANQSVILSMDSFDTDLTGNSTGETISAVVELDHLNVAATHTSFNSSNSLTLINTNQLNDDCTQAGQSVLTVRITDARTLGEISADTYVGDYDITATVNTGLQQ